MTHTLSTWTAVQGEHTSTTGVLLALAGMAVVGLVLWLVRR